MRLGVGRGRAGGATRGRSGVASASPRRRGCRRRRTRGRSPTRCRPGSRLPVGRVEHAIEDQQRRPAAGDHHDRAVAAGQVEVASLGAREQHRDHPAATRKIAASTNETSPKALMLCELIAPVLRSRLCSPYQAGTSSRAAPARRRRQALLGLHRTPGVRRTVEDRCHRGLPDGRLAAGRSLAPSLGARATANAFSGRRRRSCRWSWRSCRRGRSR